MAQKAVTIENFIENWNAEFSDYQLGVEDLKKTHSMIGALFQILDRLGIDRDSVLKPPGEENLNEHIGYYYDLLPVINMTRVINHLVSVMPQMAKISVNHFLQPTAPASHSILLLLFNLMVFNEQHLQTVAPYEDELFKFSNTIKALQDRRSELFEMLNRQAEEKGKRAKRMEEMQEEIQHLEEELHHEEAALEKEKQELEPLVKENEATDILLDQKRATKEGLLADRDRKKAMRVYDADDIRAQAAQATQNVQEAEEKLDSLKSVIAQKENSLLILQTIKPNLDTANNLLHEISKLTDTESCGQGGGGGGGGVDGDAAGSLSALQAELGELRAREAALCARWEQAHAHRREHAARRHHDTAAAESALHEAEEQDKKRRDFITRAHSRVHDIRELTTQHQQEKEKGLHTIQQIREQYCSAVKSWEEALVKLVADFKMDIDKKIISLNVE